MRELQLFMNRPYRIKETISDLAEIMADREIALIREISKMHEEKIYGMLQILRKRLLTGR